MSIPKPTGPGDIVSVKGDYDSLVKRCIAYIDSRFHDSAVLYGYICLNKYRMGYSGLLKKYIEIRDNNIPGPSEWGILIYPDKIEAFDDTTRSVIPDIDCVLNMIGEQINDIDYFN